METKQAADLDNLVIGPGGRYIRSRYATVKKNSTEIGTASDAFGILGLGILNLNSTNSYILAIKKGKAYGASLSTGNLSFSDVTGALTIATQVNTTEPVTIQWSFCTHNSLLIGFGGYIATPDAPFKWSGTGNAAALGGSPPSAAFGFSANNRVFGCRTAANPAILQWSVLGNPEDWTGTGSGSTTIGTLDDGDPVTGVALLPQNILLVFKPKTTYQVSLVTAPFPQYLLYENVGAQPGSPVVVDGKVYFITMANRGMVTDGDRIEPLPPMADDLLQLAGDGMPSTIRYFTHGFRRRGRDFDLVCWMICGSTTSVRFSIAWDLVNKCWLKFSNGLNFCSSATAGGVYGNLFFGGYYNQGFVFGMDDTASVQDDTGENSGKINAYWRSGWMTQDSNFGGVTQIQNLMVGHDTVSASPQSLTVNYGFGFVPDQKSLTFSQTPVSTETETIHTSTVQGNGNGFQFKLGQNTTANKFRANRVWIGGKSSGQKALVP